MSEVDRSHRDWVNYARWEAMGDDYYEGCRALSLDLIDVQWRLRRQEQIERNEAREIEWRLKQGRG